MIRSDQMENQRLPFPTRPLKVQGGIIEEYIIPDDHKEVVLKLLYPFVSVPSLDEEMIDIHEDRKFVVKDYRVVREGNWDALVSPYYPISGGSVIDWMPLDCAFEFDEDTGAVTCPQREN